ncbi:MAG: Rab family GTPase [Candidatus Hodarchaeota archaeon]
MTAFLLKSIVLGDGAIGKTTLLHRWIDGVFLEDLQMTIGVTFHTYKTKHNGVPCNLVVWDLGGQRQFREMGVFEKYLRGASGMLVGFDLTSLNTFQSIPDWLDFIHKNAGKVPLVLFGTKADLIEEREVEQDLIDDTVKEYGFKAYFETSAKSGQCVKEVFQKLILEAFEEQNRKKAQRAK